VITMNYRFVRMVSLGSVGMDFCQLLGDRFRDFIVFGAKLAVMLRGTT